MYTAMMDLRLKVDKWKKMEVLEFNNIRIRFNYFLCYYAFYYDG